MNCTQGCFTPSCSLFRVQTVSQGLRLCLRKVLSWAWVCVYVHTSECFLKSTHKQDKGLWALFPPPQCLWSALGRMLLCCAVSPLVPCGASLHALISDLDAVYMPEAVRLHTEPSHCAVCTFLASPAMTKLGSSVNLQTEPLTTGQSPI